VSGARTSKGLELDCHDEGALDRRFCVLRSLGEGVSYAVEAIVDDAGAVEEVGPGFVASPEVVDEMGGVELLVNITLDNCVGEDAKLRMENGLCPTTFACFGLTAP